MNLNDYIIITIHFLVCPPSSPSELQAHFSSTQLLQDLTPEAELSRQSQSLSRDSGLGHQQQTPGPQLSLGVSKQHNVALQRVGSALGSGKSASADDLLERSEERPTTPHHYRSRSSPTVERLNQVTLHSHRGSQFIW